MRKNRVVEQNRCYHLVSQLVHQAFFLDDEEKDRAVALMRRVEAGVQASMSYCINRTVSDQTLLPPKLVDGVRLMQVVELAQRLVQRRGWQLQ